ncbi:MAG: LacI family DNA-binding transcriptional regulator [Pseudomonadota bacterium]|nr:LacI family DNA-binding transcriptional regulator [Pseudomonadota bacterium]
MGALAFRVTELGNKTPKIQDVAHAAGVSTATVSRALSQPGMVAETTRLAVMAAVEKTGYRINLAASNLRRRRTGTIVAMVPSLGNPFFSTILAAIESVASPAGFDMLIVDTSQPHAGRQQVFTHLHRARADGLVVLDGSLAVALREAGENGAAIPPAIFACEWPKDSHFPCVMIDNRHGAEVAIRHLHELGHRKIGHVCGPEGNVLTDTRRGGVEDALCALGLERRQEWFLPGDFGLQSGADAADAWIAMADRPTAMFCSSDQMACGFISQLHQRGVSVPGDVSVVGFDDIEIASRFIPPLTTIRQPRREIGTAAAKMLIERIRHPEEDVSSAPWRYLPVELIVRDSTARPAGELATGLPATDATSLPAA